MNGKALRWCPPTSSFSIQPASSSPTAYHSLSTLHRLASWEHKKCVQESKHSVRVLLACSHSTLNQLSRTLILPSKKYLGPKGVQRKLVQWAHLCAYSAHTEESLLGWSYLFGCRYQRGKMPALSLKRLQYKIGKGTILMCRIHTPNCLKCIIFRVPRNKLYYKIFVGIPHQPEAFRH